MVEAQLINLILKDKTIKYISENNLSTEVFLTERDKLEFIIEHHQKYGVTPDITTFIAKYDTFEVMDIVESPEYLAYKIKEAYMFTQTVPVIQQVAQLVKDDSYKAVRYLKDEVDKLIKATELRTGRGYDIINKADDRLKEHIKRRERGGMVGIPTGSKLLNDLLFGWLEEDLIILFARTNMGKTWLILYFLTVAWSVGYKVVMYSGEMSKHVIGFRFDTMYKNWSNIALMQGSTALGSSNIDEVGHRELEDYESYVRDLSTKDGFIVVTPRDDFGGDRPTVSQLKELMEVHGGDILGIDQLSLMKDERKGENNRIRYTHIAEDLRLLTEELQKPIIALAQANRKGAMIDDDETPELGDIAESDGIPQNATRVLSFNVVDNVLRISIKKNTYGEKDKDVLFTWNKNFGLIKPLLEGGENATEYGF